MFLYLCCEELNTLRLLGELLGNLLFSRLWFDSLIIVILLYGVHIRKD